jgi:hypothetical protein
MKYRRLFGAAAALCFSTVAAASAATSWLDRKPVASWNKAGAAVPRAGKGDASNDARCASGARKPAAADDRRVVAAGWKLVGARQSFGATTVVQGAAGFDGMCRWAGYQAFVFVNGTYAGTLAPKAMDSRTDGALDTVHLASSNQFTADFVRYADTDPLCCPTRTSYVTYAIARGPVVRATEVTTTANAH